MKLKFYEPADAQAAGNVSDPAGNADGNQAGNGEQSGFVIKGFRDGERAFDLSNPEHVKQIQGLAEKGTQYTILQDRLSSQQKAIDAANLWENILQSAARGDEAAAKQIAERVSQFTGKQFGFQEAAQNDKGEFIDEALAKEVQQLKSQLNQMTTQTQAREEQQLVAQWGKDLSDLEAKYGNDFSRDAVLDALEQYGITRPNKEIFEKIHIGLNHEKLLAAAQKAAKTKQQEVQQKRDAAFTESGDGGGIEPSKARKKYASFQQVGDDILAEMKQKGESFFE